MLWVLGSARVQAGRYRHRLFQMSLTCDSAIYRMLRRFDQRFGTPVPKGVSPPEFKRPPDIADFKLALRGNHSVRRFYFRFLADSLRLCLAQRSIAPRLIPENLKGILCSVVFSATRRGARSAKNDEAEMVQ